MSAPSQDGVKFNDIISLLWVTLKQSAGGVVVFSRKVAPLSNVPVLSSQRTRRVFRIRPFRLNFSSVEASGTHVSSKAKTHPTAVLEIQKERILPIELSTVQSEPTAACSQMIERRAISQKSFNKKT